MTEETHQAGRLTGKSVACIRRGTRF